MNKLKPIITTLDQEPSDFIKGYYTCPVCQSKDSFTLLRSDAPTEDDIINRVTSGFNRFHIHNGEPTQ